MATPFPFGSGNTLLAAQLNAITTLPVSTKTASYTLTVADLGTRVVMNSASATTITVNTSIFGASDKVEILNIGAGVCTVTAGTCTVGTSGSLALAQNAGGTLTFISASASVFTASAISSGLTLLSTTTIGTTVSSVSLPASTFTSTYSNYKIFLNCSQSTAASAQLTINTRLRSASTDESGASYSWNGFTSAGSLTNNVASNQTSFLTVYVRDGFPERSWAILDIMSPQQSKPTQISVNSFSDFGGTFYNLFENGMLNTTTSYDSLTFVVSGGTLSGGKISVYGYSI
jgi:hypothetical protein